MAQETDSNEHMNVQFYTTRYDMASGQLMAVLGKDFQSMKKEGFGQSAGEERQGERGENAHR